MSNLPIERVVTLLHPVFAAAGAWLAALLAVNVPGAPRLDATTITGVEIAAFVSISGIVYKWLHGRQLMLPRATPVIPAAAGVGSASAPPAQ